jgi:rfaE bifunctional protein nucleotidyltransferase chain/domain
MLYMPPYTPPVGTPATRTKILERAPLLRALDVARAAGRRVVLTNGCFDLLHVGHARYLGQAAALGDVLVVAVNADDSVRALKGPGRPLVPAAERAELLAALAAVDYVTIFPELTVEALLRATRPDVWVKGGDYRPDDLIEAPVARAVGAEVRMLDLQPGRSTSGLLAQIRASAP